MEIQKPALRLLLILGAAVVVVLVVSGVFFFSKIWPVKGLNGGASTQDSTPSLTPEGRVQMQKEMAASSAGVTVTPDEKQILVNQMSQLVTATTSKTSAQTTPAPVVTSAEKQKLLDAMQQKVK
jgi:hypothetical protein